LRGALIERAEVAWWWRGALIERAEVVEGFVVR
jgi:hypothetical protein